MARNPFKRSVDVPDAVVRAAGLPRGEKVLAGTATRDGGWLLGTRDALVVVPADGRPDRIVWQQVERADWDRDADRLRIAEVGEFGRPRPEHAFGIDEPGLMLDLIRERVTASVVLQRHVPVHGRKGLFVVARRAPTGDGEITWAYEFERGVDPDDPAVAEAAEAGLRAAAEELGL